MSESNSHEYRTRASKQEAASSMTPIEIDQLENKYGKKFIDLLPKGFQFTKLLGTGSYGAVFLICKGIYKCRVFKIQTVKNGQHIAKEVSMQKKFHALGMAPKVYGVEYYMNDKTEYAVIEMEKIDGTLATYLEAPRSTAELDSILYDILGFITKMCKHKLTHGDFHGGNIGYSIEDVGDRLTAKLLLIDFGWASKGKCFPELELIQFLRTSGMLSDPRGVKSNEANITYLQDTVLGIYRNNYNTKLENSWDSWNAEWEYELDRYRKYLSKK